MDLLINHQDSGTFNDHVQRENLTKEYEMEICIDSENDIAIDLSRVDSESSIISHIENDFQEKSSFLEEQLSKLSGSLREVSKPSVSYRTELKRPDLKGTFRCSICQKIFCHSSSLSRHRMQAHFKSYTCTLCRKEITIAGCRSRTSSPSSKDDQMEGENPEEMKRKSFLSPCVILSRASRVA
uniref:C2H2-type domain-containing protein n=1 Tax=Acrobeloides nanus TaxID=290746 RepID=A0A914C2E9_9BILA